MEDSGFNVDANDITSKFTSLRSYFSQERAKITASKSGDGADAVIESRWKFFPRLMFLSDNMTPRSVYSTLSNEPADKGKKRKTSASHLENVEKLMATAVHCLQTPGPSETNKTEKSEGEIFCELLVKKLEKLPDGQEKEDVKMKMLMDLNKALFTPSH